MMNLSGVTLNINAEKAFVFFPNDSTSNRLEKPQSVCMSGESEESMSRSCQQFADGKITRKDLVNSLVSFLGEA